MISDHGSPSWKLKCIVAEVGCRGYIPPSFRKALQHFGFTSKELKTFSIKHFPQDICQTKKQVDAFVISQSRKICLVGPELTVPIEERIAFWNEKKQENMTR